MNINNKSNNNDNIKYFYNAFPIVPRTSTLLQIGPTLKKQDEGIYACFARNSVGETNSAALRVTVHCASNEETTTSTNFSILQFRFFGSILALALLLATALTVVAAWRNSSGIQRSSLRRVAGLPK